MLVHANRLGIYMFSTRIQSQIKTKFGIWLDLTNFCKLNMISILKINKNTLTDPESRLFPRKPGNASVNPLFVI